MRQILTLSVFAKKLGYSSASDREFREQLKLLQTSGVVKVQQSGYSGHSTAHPKNVVMTKDIEDLFRFHESKKDPEIRDLFCCPFCGRAINIFDCLKNVWMLGSVCKLSAEHGVCCGKFELVIVDKLLIQQLRKVIPFKGKRRKRSLYHEA